MIYKINFFKLKNNPKTIWGLSNNHKYGLFCINPLYFLLCYDIKISYLPVKTIKLELEEKEYIKHIENSLINFENLEIAIKHFNRQDLINNIIND